MLAKVSGQISAADKEATEKKEDLVGERQQLDLNRRANAVKWHVEEIIFLGAFSLPTF